MTWLWPVAAVAIAALAWDVARRHISTRTLWDEARVAALEAKAEALKDTGKVIQALHARVAAAERAVKGFIAGDGE